MHLGICHIPLIPCRGSADEKSEMVTQLLFGELYEILEISKGWVRIRSLWDDYVAWISKEQYFQAEEKYAAGYTAPPYTLARGSFCRFIHGQNGCMHIPAGSRLPEEDIHIGGETWVFKGDKLRIEKASGGEQLFEYAKQYLHTAYLWGGRSSFGMDCSGLVQMTAMFGGIRLMRDASEQVQAGKPVTALSDVQAGDIAFFSDRKGKIAHTGILDGKGNIIHASGKVRIDKLDAAGIFNEEEKRHTHQLESIRRIV